MGFYARSSEVDMYFPAHIIKEAHNALVEYCKDADDRSGWTDDIGNSRDLKEALELLHFEVYVNKDCSLTVESREYEKLSIYQDNYFAALAPFVHSEPVGNEEAKQGGYIIWMGEDGRFWRDSFANGELTRQSAQIQFVFD